jgi:hypothetical protein
MTSAHTPGPWTADFEEDVALFPDHTPIDAPKWGALAQVVTSIEGEGHDAKNKEGVANLHLILAAPDMLEALRAIIEFWSHGTPVFPGSLVAEEVISILARIDGENT